MADHAVDDPLDDVGWRAHLFRTRSEDQIGQWARALTYFRFCRGQASPFFTEPDRLVAALGWTDDQGRRAVLEGLGLAEGADRWQELAGVRVRVEHRPGRVLLSVSGAEQRRPEIVDRDIEAAAAVEPLLAPLAEHVVDPPIDDRSCISPSRYPRLFDEPT